MSFERHREEYDKKVSNMNHDAICRALYYKDCRIQELSKELNALLPNKDNGDEYKKFEIWEEGENPRLVATYRAKEFLGAIGKLKLNTLHLKDVVLMGTGRSDLRYFLDGKELFDSKEKATKK